MIRRRLDGHETFDSLFKQVQRLTISERLRILELIAATIQVDLARQMDWHSALKATYGILADDPIERPPQLPLEDREPLE